MADMYLSDEDKKKLEELQKAQSIPLPFGGLEGEALAKMAEATRPKPAEEPKKVSKAVQFKSDEEEEDNQEESPSQPSLFDKVKNLPSSVPAKQDVSDSIGKLLSQQQDEFKKAQAIRDNLQFLATMGQAGHEIGAGIAGARSNPEAYKEFFNLAKQPVEDLSKKQEFVQRGLKNASVTESLKNEMSKQDANSDISKVGRQIAQAAAKTAGLGIQIPDSISLSNLEKLMPGIENMANRRLVAENQLAGKKAQMSAKEQQDVDKAVVNLGKDLDPNNFRSGQMRINQNKVDAAERLEALLKQFPDRNIPAIQTRELASSLGALLTSGSQTAVSQINELVPKTMAGNAAKIAEWFTGKPTGGQQQEFIKLFEDTAKREKETAQNQILRAQWKKAYSTHGKLKEKSPDDFYRTMSQATGLDPEEIQQLEKDKSFKGDFLSKKKLNEQDKEAIKWAKENPDDPRAQKILQMHGM